ncbi:Cytochrome c551 peroxidase [hydrothermal vent metagenome]|uniref:Cytochrome c551 peroxidase n=1 Tax=hydrothermal vent metagenome TaxID=652676 RepID=A0A3B1CMZ4_9ZZZZ
MKIRITFLILTFSLSLFLISCGEKKESVDRTAMIEKAKTVFGVLPDKMPGSENDTPGKIALGKKLYFDDRLSVNDQQSCNTCHMLDDNGAGVDNLETSPGAVDGEIGVRNSPTVLNAGFHFVQFWDGREPDLKHQAKGPILNPIEMGMPDSNTVVKKFKKIPEYKKLFAAAGMKITYDNIAEAIAAFERTLITKDRFDMFMKGNPQALKEDEVEGLALFINQGCITCHTGPLLGGNMYQKMGLVKPYADTTDKGRFDVTGNEADKFMFKVPSLRNVVLTDPYMHDGKVQTLKDAIVLMADIQLGKTLKDDEVNKIEKFLGSLSDIKLAKANKK